MPSEASSGATAAAPSETVQAKSSNASFAPSWSFRSATGCVSLVPNPERFTSFHQMVQVYRISQELASSANLFGSGTGTIDIEGCVVPVRVEDSSHAAARRDALVFVCG